MLKRLSGKKSPEKSIFATENAQAIIELLNAIDECNVLLEQYRDYFRKIEKQTEDENFIKLTPPSEQEVQMMQERWSAS